MPRRVNAEVRLRCYKGSVSVLSRSSETEKLYDPEEASMDSLVDFSPMDTSMFFKPTLLTPLDFPTAIDCPEF
ncbi:argininosuccinate synthetase [Trichoglossum hirsutum]|uniref:Argininosuccinate synthetase n=1 Tax=Trichoglossum hirsutum TaxID=265104 RepID=A0A9P8LDS0_9PEZI|nr:argininosuccinate synthetase [Trichoglossum hirsutum]